MLVQGVALLVVSRQLGHASPDVTARVYAHLIDDERLDSAAAAFMEASDPETVRAPVREHKAGS